ncbi:Uncharacterised protein [Mycobacteroides abscessus subsp. massiliense]|nr:Uncharacterised protein [Mycobacteroides abscessus subsp. massiliense]
MSKCRYSVFPEVRISYLPIATPNRTMLSAKSMFTVGPNAFLPCRRPLDTAEAAALIKPSLVTGYPQWSAIGIALEIIPPESFSAVVRRPATASATVPVS